MLQGSRSLPGWHSPLPPAWSSPASEARWSSAPGAGPRGPPAPVPMATEDADVAARGGTFGTQGSNCRASGAGEGTRSAGNAMTRIKSRRNGNPPRSRVGGGQTSPGWVKTRFFFISPPVLGLSQAASVGCRAPARWISALLCSPGEPEVRRILTGSKYLPLSIPGITFMPPMCPHRAQEGQGEDEQSPALPWRSSRSWGDPQHAAAFTPARTRNVKGKR